MIDSHHSFCKHRAGELAAVDNDAEGMPQDFLLAEFEHDLEYSGVDQVVSIQSRRSDSENVFLLEQAALSDDLVTGIIGWAPLASSDLRVFLEKYAFEPLIKGYREAIDDVATADYFQDPDFDRGIAELTQRNLTMDISVSADQLPALIQLVDRHPNQPFVLNHSGHPVSSSSAPCASWTRNIRELARRPHLFCKLSAMNPSPNTALPIRSADLRPYFDTLLHAFGPKRLMFGSDWPHSMAYTTYPAWLNVVDDFIDPLSYDEKNAIVQETAIDFYKL